MGILQKMLAWIPQLLLGARVTIALTVLAVSAGLVLSLFLALGKISRNSI
jgi:polar amino acid transport system permease protein